MFSITKDEVFLRLFSTTSMLFIFVGDADKEKEQEFSGSDSSELPSGFAIY